MNRCEYYPILKEKFENIEAFSEIERTFRKCEEYLAAHEQILVSVSGGSDSDCIVHIFTQYFSEYMDKFHFVFCNTGLEYDATKRHLDYLEQKYNIKIERVRGKSVVWAVKTYGVPILNKYKANMIDAYQRGQKHAERYIFDDDAACYHVMRFTERQREMVRYATANGIKISDKCCDISKKKPLHDYEKAHKIDLNVTGERYAEGGRRAISHKSCFEEHANGRHKFMPLWWWSDDVKAEFKRVEGIVYSDCYEVWGMLRTGCVGCPFSLEIKEDLEKMKQYEPQMYKACMNVFGVSYELTEGFQCHHHARRDGEHNTMWGKRNEDSPLAKKVMCVETGKVYNCMKVAAEETGLFATAITQVCKGKRKTHGGFHWKYVE